MPTLSVKSCESAKPTGRECIFHQDSWTRIHLNYLVQWRKSGKCTKKASNTAHYKTDPLSQDPRPFHVFLGLGWGEALGSTLICKENSNIVWIDTEVNKSSARESEESRLRVQCVRLSSALIYRSIKISCLTAELDVEWSCSVKTRLCYNAGLVAATVIQEVFVLWGQDQKFVDISLSGIAIVLFNNRVLTL